MYELSRVRLHSVGPKAARYQDVTLDLRGVGAPVTGPAQPSFFDDGRAPLRPSPASVLFAENGNGKSVLIKLIFSVMLPGKRQVVGTTNSRALENFVLAGDVSHVVLEWQHTVTGEVVVTGKVAAWRGHAVSSDPTRLVETWYSFRPTDTLSLDTLPFTQDGRLVELAGFRDRLSEAHKEDARLQLVWEQVHGVWTEHLNTLGLDSELFAYQRTMNAGEGEAADAFTFKSDEAFVDWLLTSVTDEEDPRGLADVLEGYAATLSQRDALAAERDFISGALDRLTPLAGAAEAARDAASADQQAARTAGRFAASIRERLTQERSRVGALQQGLDAAQERDAAAESDHRRLREIVAELRRRVAGMRLADAERSAQALDASLDDARSVVEAWRVTDALLALGEAQQKAAALRAVVGDQESKAAPTLAARDRAATRLVQGLLARAADADALVAQADARARDLKAQIDAVSAEADGHGKAAGTHGARAVELDERIQAAQAAVAAAVEEGLVAADQEPEAAARQAEQAERALSDRMRQAADAQREAAADRVEAARAARAADQALSDARHAAAAAEQAHADAQARTQALSCEERLAALLGADEVRLLSDAPVLQERLVAAVAAADQERMQLRMDDAADRKVLDALGTGGLLPPSADVAAVKDALEQAGIPSYAGWEYLSQLPAHQQPRVLATYPHLVDGVVLHSPQHLDEARQVLTDARLLPRTVVAVGTTVALADLDAPAPAGLGLIVPPNPAMYDDDLAEAERQHLEGVHEERMGRLAALTAQIDADRALAGRLDRWLTAFPGEHLAALADAHDAAARALADAESRAAAAQERLDQSEARTRELAEALDALRAEQDVARALTGRLSMLARDVAHVTASTRTLAAAHEDAARAEAAATDARRRAAALREQLEQTLGDRHAQARNADDARAEISGVTGGGSALDAAVDTEADATPQDVPTLRAAYRAAVDAYAKVEVGADLRVDLERAEAIESDARAAVERLEAPVRAAATALLATPDGGDAPARAAAARRAVERVRELELRTREAAEQIGALREDHRRHPRHDRPLEPYGAPEDVEHGAGLIDRATADEVAAAERHEDARRQLREAAEQVAEVQKDVDVYGVLAERVADLRLDPADDDAEPFAGDQHLARERCEQVLRAAAASRTRLAEATAELRDASKALSRYAASPQFDAVESLVQRQIRDVDLDELPGHAAEWEDALRPRLRTLRDDLAQIERHRTQLTARLRGLVEVALTTLRSAEKVSVLPDTLGDWGGQKFLRIRFADPDPTLLDEQLAQVIDAAAAVRGDKPRKRDGMSLLLQGVHAALPQGVKVEMLKPDASLRTERVRIADVAHVYSGGQLLTSAIVLYCTMAALRANDRGISGRRHAGVLFLDNPIGRASAGYLLDLQLGVAAALGVQLVYTTGLFDTNALSVFPLIVRLRNDRDLRTGMRYLIVEDEIRAQLDALGEDDGTGRLTSTRIYRKPVTTG
ncbi:hypothetical protein [Cellulomonas chengniuliangii]|uniref:hypothetical protein n=1 Tax=Cellulomonas chengniuliangii TaxID=2968084 RepID=UPI001D0F0AEB|nr:hypothetical protein [Cellulomonas chengniuliangii]MCC2318524.1 hypothetical protein [Cellulomonas chengniuliangii]